MTRFAPQFTQLSVLRFLKVAVNGCLGFAVVMSTCAACAADDFSQNHFDIRARQLERVAEELDGEIEAHLYNFKGYRKLQVVNGQIRRTAAAVGRRVDRDPGYRRLDKNVEKLQELTGELNSRYSELLVELESDSANAFLAGDTTSVATRITDMRSLADSMNAVADAGHVPVASEQIPLEGPAASQSGSSFDIAPAFAPEAMPGPQSPNFAFDNIAPPAAPQTTAPQQTNPTMRSVLEN